MITMADDDIREDREDTETPEDSDNEQALPEPLEPLESVVVPESTSQPPPESPESPPEPVVAPEVSDALPEIESQGAAVGEASELPERSLSPPADESVLEPDVSPPADEFGVEPSVSPPAEPMGSSESPSLREQTEAWVAGGAPGLPPIMRRQPPPDEFGPDPTPPSTDGPGPFSTLFAQSATPEPPTEPPALPTGTYYPTPEEADWLEREVGSGGPSPYHGIPRTEATPPESPAAEPDDDMSVVEKRERARNEEPGEESAGSDMTDVVQVLNQILGVAAAILNVASSKGSGGNEDSAEQFAAISDQIANIDTRSRYS